MNGTVTRSGPCKRLHYPGPMTSPDLAERPYDLTSGPGSEWWRTAVIYQIYPRSFADAPATASATCPASRHTSTTSPDLGVDAIWLSPFMRSPQKDAGYDVADYCDVDPLFGTLADFDAMLAEAHGRGIRVIVDLVPNHSSDQHVWFQAALAAGPGSPERARYMFRDGQGRERRAAPEQLGVRLRRPRVDPRRSKPTARPASGTCTCSTRRSPTSTGRTKRCARSSAAILRFWLDRGVDGFRVDVAHGLIKADGLPDYTPPADAASMGGDEDGRARTGASPACTTSTATGTRCSPSTTATARCAPRPGCRPPTRRRCGCAPDEMHQAFNFPYLETPWDAAELARRHRRVARARSAPSARRARGCSRTTTWCGTRRASRSPPRTRRVTASARISPGKPIADARPAPRPRRDER